MTDLNQLQNEIREHCGEEFLKALPQEVRRQRRYLYTRYAIWILLALAAIILWLLDYFEFKTNWFIFDGFILVWLGIFSFFNRDKIFYYVREHLFIPPDRPIHSWLAWLTYISFADDPSPRAWNLYFYNRNKKPPCMATALRCAGMIHVTDLWKSEVPDYTNRPYEKKNECAGTPFMIRDWIYQNRGLIDVRQYFLRQLYFKRFDAKLFESISVPDIGKPISLEPIDSESSPGTGFQMMEALASNGSLISPVFTAYEINLIELDMDSVVSQAFQKFKIVDEMRDNNYFSTKSRNKAIEDQKKTLGLLDEDPQFDLVKVLANGETEVETNYTSEYTLYVIRNLLYCFYTTPWRSESFQRKLPYHNKKGGVVNLHLDYQPKEYIRLERLPI